MNLANVADQIRTALDTVTGLQVPPWGSKASGLPAALVGFPPDIEWTSTYGRGKARVPDWPVYIVVGLGNSQRSAYKRMSELLTDQAGGVLAAIEGYAYTACDSVFVSPRGEFDADARYGASQVIVATLHCDVNGPGK